MTVLAGRHAVVTGGSRGIGRATASALVAAGATVTIVGRDQRALRAAVNEGHAHGFAVADVTDRAVLGNGLRLAAEARGRIDILVANAGGAESAPFEKSGPELFRRLFDLNAIGSVNAMQAVLGGMISAGFGRIVAIASIAGLKGAAYVTAYCAAKHAVVGLVRALAVETAKTGVTVNAICPGYVDTDLVTASLDQITAKTGRPREQALASILKSTPLGRLIRPEEIAATVLFLCSAEAAAITGAAIPITGGEI